MTRSNLIISRSQSSHLALLALLSQLLGEVIDDGQELRMAKMYQLDRLSLAEQEQVASKAGNHPFYHFPLSERVFQVENVLIHQEAVAPVAFNHEHITPFSAGPSRLTCGGTGIFSGLQRRALVPGLTLVELPFFRGSLPGHP